jgi:predicted amidohydrolase
MRAYLSRWVCLDPESNLTRFRDETAAAVAGGAELVVFPELFLTGYTRLVEPERAWAAFAEASRAAGDVLLVAGSVSVGRANRLTCWCSGDRVAAYDKVHLFRPNGEHARWDPGDRYVALTWRGLTIGLMNCNDVRFPEQARALRFRAGAELLIAPAWWPWRRDHVWRTLLSARAIENSVWVLGCAIEASVAPGEEFAGAGNHVFDPGGEPVRTPDDRFWELDLAGAAAPVVDTAAQFVDVGRVERDGKAV